MAGSNTWPSGAWCVLLVFLVSGSSLSRKRPYVWCSALPCICLGPHLQYCCPRKLLIGFGKFWIWRSFHFSASETLMGCIAAHSSDGFRAWNWGYCHMSWCHVGHFCSTKPARIVFRKVGGGSQAWGSHVHNALWEPSMEWTISSTAPTHLLAKAIRCSPQQGAH